MRFEYSVYRLILKTQNRHQTVLFSYVSLLYLPVFRFTFHHFCPEKKYKFPAYHFQNITIGGNT